MLADIKFLQTVRDINNNPEDYSETNRGKLPANTASIKRATDLTDQQVSYRMGGNSNSKGFEEGSDPLIVSHRGEATESGFAPRSVELTSAGVDALQDAQRIGSKLEGITREEFDNLKLELDTLRKEVRVRDIFGNRNGDIYIHHKHDHTRAIISFLRQESSEYRTLWNTDEGVIIVTYDDGDVINKGETSDILNLDGIVEKVCRSFD